MMRMQPEGGHRTADSERKTRNSLNMQGSRTHYGPYKLVSWFPRRTMNGQARLNVLSSLSPAQIARGTTRGSTPGLINPALGDVAGNRIGLPDLGNRIGRRGARKRNATQANIGQGNVSRTTQRRRLAQDHTAARTSVRHQ